MVRGKRVSVLGNAIIKRIAQVDNLCSNVFTAICSLLGRIKMLRLGSGTGSLWNHMDSRAVRGEPEVEIGMGATRLLWSDRHAGTIVAVQNIRGTTYITVQDDSVTRSDKNGMSESQDYEYQPNPNAPTYFFKKHTKTGFWKECQYNPQTKRFNQLKHGNGLKIGVRDEYYDFSF